MDTTRIFIPSEKWWYFKFYTGVKSADRLLTEGIMPFVEAIEAKGMMENFFFIRYSDPSFHIRFRVQLKETADLNLFFALFHSFFKPLAEHRLIWDIQCDTYKRELERYGKNTIDILENIFCADSRGILNLVKERESNEDQNSQWQVALVLLDDLFNLFGMDLKEKEEFAKRGKEGYLQEFGFTNNKQQISLDQKYRDNTKLIYEAMERKFNKNILQAFQIRSVSMKPFVEQLIEIEKAGKLEVDKKSLLLSIVHMTINRLFRSKNRLCELIIYFYIHKYYVSMIARSKQKEKQILQPSN